MERNEHFLDQFNHLFHRLNLATYRGHSLPGDTKIAKLKRDYYAYIEKTYPQWHNERANANSQRLVEIEKQLNSLEEKRIMAKEAFERHLYTREKLVERKQELLFAKEAQRKEAAEMKLKVAFLTHKEKNFQEAFNIATEEAQNLWKADQLAHLNNKSRDEMQASRTHMAHELSEMYSPDIIPADSIPAPIQLSNHFSTGASIPQSSSAIVSESDPRQGSLNSFSSAETHHKPATTHPFHGKESKIPLLHPQKKTPRSNIFSIDSNCLKKLIETVEMAALKEPIGVYCAPISANVKKEILKMASGGDSLQCWGPDSVSMAVLDHISHLSRLDEILPSSFIRTYFYENFQPSLQKVDILTLNQCMNESSQNLWKMILRHLAFVIRHEIVSFESICDIFSIPLAGNHSQENPNVSHWISFLLYETLSHDYILPWKPEPGELPPAFDKDSRLSSKNHDFQKPTTMKPPLGKSSHQKLDSSSTVPHTENQSQTTINLPPDSTLGDPDKNQQIEEQVTSQVLDFSYCSSEDENSNNPIEITPSNT